MGRERGEEILPGQMSRRSYPVLLVVTLAAYIPFFLDPAWLELAPGRTLLLLLLGLLYLFLGTAGWGAYERFQNHWAFLFYFAAQITLVSAILLLGQGVAGGFWLLVLPIAAQSVGLSRTGTVLVVGVILLALLLVGFRFGLDLAASLQLVVGIAAGIVFVVVFTQVAIREEDARREVERLAAELQEANQQLRAYASQVEELATTKERNRLAREIHDSLGHYLTALNMQLGAAQAVLATDQEQALDALDKAQQLAQEGLADVRRSVAALRDRPTGGRSLPEAIAACVAEMEATGVVTALQVAGTARPLDARHELTLFRAAQEALTNARKHAHASRVDLLLDYSDPGGVRLAVSDNGVGTATTGGGFGLLGVRERVTLLGGEMHVDTEVGKGLVLAIWLPS